MSQKTEALKQGPIETAAMWVDSKLDALNIRPRDIMSNVMSFTAAHAGCFATPVLSSLTSGAVSSEAGLPVAMAMSVLATFTMDRWLSRISPLGCVRCIISKLDTFKRDALLLLQAVSISTAVHFMNEASGHHASHGGHSSHRNGPEVQKTADGRLFTIRENYTCGPNSAGAPGDTIWLKPLTPEKK